ncbi:MAG: hypothetical protein PHO62_08000 [Sulfurimonas sp.]|uniref:hypothetical protein n=1 Tax=Sulfurimonas sp. TaxID=2022749 RepID=UPI002614F6E2|nr:hypothetical protein [Sulfurimonas sp.]MDD5373350.1 hypothetical protein [Sulfurimonas sp.]
MKKHIEEEIEALSYNLDVVIKKLHSGVLSAAGVVAAQEVAKTLVRIRDFIGSAERDENEVHKIITKLPLLYFQIPKLN